MSGSHGDWRLRGQERYLAGAVMVRRPYSAPRPDWDHDHCEFCFVKFGGPGDDVERWGYCTTDEYWWVCPRCFRDFRERFAWKLVPDAGDETA